MHLGLVRSLALAVALTSLGTPLARADQDLEQARSLLAQKRAQEAYALLRPLESNRAGALEFDYLLGIAALDAGDAQAAVFALERVLAVNPNYLQARAEIARAYFVLGERENARREFQAVRGQDLPPEARATIDRFLSALEPQATQFRAYLEAGVGYDSNVNSATARGQIAIPALGGLIGTLDPGSVKKGDGFWGLGGGASVSHALGREWWLIGAASYAGKFNFDEDRFDTGQFDGSAGARWARGADQIIGLAQGQVFRVDSDTFRTSAGGTVQWLHDLSTTQQFTLFGQFAALRYPDQDPRNANRWIGGAAYSQAFAAPFAPIGYVSAYAGTEKERDSAFSWLGHKPLGFRLGGQLQLAARAVLFGSASYEYRRYNGQDPSFLLTRRDDQYDVRLGLAYTFLPLWTLTPQVAYTNNRSNIELNRFDRTVTSVIVRRDF